jgi:N-methylhydantoinase A
VEALLSDAEVFVHGTTIATNAVIQGRGAKVAVLCTAGFRDVLYFRDNFKPDRFDIHRPHPEPLVRRHLRLGIPERVGADGAVVSPLNESSVREAVATIKQHDVAAVAVAFMWSVANASHERRAAQILADELPGIPILCS